MRGRVSRPKAGGSWFYVLDVGRAESGRRKQVVKRGFRTRGEAQEALNDVLKSLGDGSYVAANRQTASEYLAEWLTSIDTTVRPTTARSYAMHVESHVKPTIGHVRLQKVTGPMLNALSAK